MRRALAIDPRERYRTAGELWGALEAAMATAAPAGAVALAAGSPPAGAAPGAVALGVSGTERVAAGVAAMGLADTAHTPAALPCA